MAKRKDKDEEPAPAKAPKKAPAAKRKTAEKTAEAKAREPLELPDEPAVTAIVVYSGKTGAEIEPVRPPKSALPASTTRGVNGHGIFGVHGLGLPFAVSRWKRSLDTLRVAYTACGGECSGMLSASSGDGHTYRGTWEEDDGHRIRRGTVTLRVEGRTLRGTWDGPEGGGSWTMALDP